MTLLPPRRPPVLGLAPRQSLEQRGEPTAPAGLPGQRMAPGLPGGGAPRAGGVLPRGGQLGLNMQGSGFGGSTVPGMPARPMPGSFGNPGATAPRAALPAPNVAANGYARKTRLDLFQPVSRNSERMELDDGTLDPQMLLVDHIAKSAEELIELVEMENMELARGHWKPVRSHQQLKSELTAAYVQSVRTLRDNPPVRNERTSPKLDQLRQLGIHLEHVVDTHMKLCEAGIRTAEQLVRKIRSDVASHDGHGLQYNHPALQNRQRKMVQERVSPVALNQVL